MIAQEMEQDVYMDIGENNMKLKELYRKFKGYDIVVFGRPLDQPTIPFTFLPKDKELKECEVVEYKVKECEVDIPYFDITGKYKGKEHIKGDVYVYVK